eukprot:4178510-Prymnesium_polylepis.2
MTIGRRKWACGTHLVGRRGPARLHSVAARSALHWKGSDEDTRAESATVDGLRRCKWRPRNDP